MLLVILASFALAVIDEDDFPLFEGGLSARAQGHPGWELLPALGLALAMCTAFLRLEYLTSHIGEKRPAHPSMTVKYISLFARRFRTVLYSRAVLFIPFPRVVDDVNRTLKIFHRLRCSHFIQSQFLIHGGFFSYAEYRPIQSFQ